MLIEAIAPATLVALRARPEGRAHVRVVAEGEEPLRCCLRDSHAGESLFLTSYAPPFPESPYAECGAVFVHAAAEDCDPLPAGFPPFSSRRSQLLRGYDAVGWQVDHRLKGPGGAETAAAELLDVASVAWVDVRNPGPGCFMFRISG